MSVSCTCTSISAVREAIGLILTQYLPVFGVKCSEHWALLQLKLLILRLLWRLFFLLQLLEGGRCAPIPSLHIGLEPPTHGLHLEPHRGCGRDGAVRKANVTHDNNMEPGLQIFSPNIFNTTIKCHWATLISIWLGNTPYRQSENCTNTTWMKGHPFW